MDLVSVDLVVPQGRPPPASLSEALRQQRAREILANEELRSAQEQLRSQMDFTPLGKECTPIEGAQNRAITLPQLIRLRDFLMSHANPDDGVMQWVDRAPPQYSATSGQALNVGAINLYQVHVCHDHQSILTPCDPIGERLGDQASH